MFNERRREERKKVTFYLRVLDAVSLELFGYLNEITEHGLMLDCDEMLSLNQDYDFSIELTDPTLGKPYLTFRANCRWCHTDPAAPSCYQAGFQIVHVGIADQEVLKQVIVRYSSDGTSRSF